MVFDGTFDKIYYRALLCIITQYYVKHYQVIIVSSMRGILLEPQLAMIIFQISFFKQEN